MIAIVMMRERVCSDMIFLQWFRNEGFGSEGSRLAQPSGNHQNQANQGSVATYSEFKKAISCFFCLSERFIWKR